MHVTRHSMYAWLSILILIYIIMIITKKKVLRAELDDVWRRDKIEMG